MKSMEGWGRIVAVLLIEAGYRMGRDFDQYSPEARRLACCLPLIERRMVQTELYLERLTGIVECMTTKVGRVQGAIDDWRRGCDSKPPAFDI